MKKHAPVTAAAVSAVLFLAGCGSLSAPDSTPDASNGSPPHDAAGGTPEAGAKHNAADTMFAQMMIPHHEQAIVMSGMMLAKEGLDPRIVALAADIKAAQGPEIRTMEVWLETWEQPRNPMEGHSMMMEGMLSDEDLAALEQAAGTDAARLFLTQMIAHHEGAVAMAREEAARGSNAAAVELAEAIAADQTSEIAEMNSLLLGL